MLPAYGVAAFGGLLMLLGGVGALWALVERGKHPGGVPYGLAAIATGLVAGLGSLMLIFVPLHFMFFSTPAPPDAFNVVGYVGALVAFVLAALGLASLVGALLPARWRSDE